MPDTGPLTVVAATEAPLHTTLLAMAFTVAIGFTVIVNDIGTPTQPDGLTGVTVIVAFIGTALALVVVNDGIFPVPLAAKPMPALLFTQLYVVPATGLPNTIGAVV